ncbi:MAG TPA: cytochrome b/b6 domain-containing protein [Anaerolineales bacterium]|nr:cytochrome b/b6 domain-containing protein [Anaerolineales bacterium]
MKKRNIFILLGLLIATIAFLGIRSALAKPEPAPVEQASPLHPTFALLDESGVNVLESGSPVSTMQTCGECHDTEFIQSHAFHSDLGLRDYTQNGGFSTSPGTFGRWDPLNYRYLSQTGDERLDLSTAEWLMLYGDRVVGGGPAAISRAGVALTDIQTDATNPESSILISETGQAEAWNWTESGTMEMNCFLCHMDSPNYEARLQAIQSGQFASANTATLVGSGLAVQTEGGFEWNESAFQENGEINEDLVFVKDPTNPNCAACHGEVHTDASPLTLQAGDLNFPQTATTGQVISGQKISESGVNLSGKNDLDRSWDVHAERQLQCTDCHYASNNPAHADKAQKAEPGHLLYDPRTLEISEYLEKPDHNFARGQSAQYNVAPELKGTMRRCESCHDANRGHADWLPYIETHMSVVACETCHIPQMYAPAIQAYDWTVLTSDKQPVKTYRGVEGDPSAVTSLVTGYKPVLLNRTNLDGQKLLAPYNLITSYYWVYEDANGHKRPVRLLDLEAAYFEGNVYAPEILSAFDADGSGSLNSNELVIDSAAKEGTVREKLIALGLNNARIEGLTQPYSINHNVARGEYAVNECTACHNDESRVSQPIKLSDYAPNGTLPVFDVANNVNASGEITQGDGGAVYYNPIPANDKMYVFGSSRVNWIDWLGALMFAGTIFGVAGHGTLRFISSRKQPKDPARTKRIYMYESYRRFWHWLQTTSIVMLLFTGLIIHRPDIFGAFSFRGVVTVHNVLAIILVVNALLSVFYHVATERVQEYIPRPYGFFDDAIVQAKYYISGIFKCEPHPFEKRPDSRMNPIQKATYFGILNVLLPLQILTGALMWGVQEFPAIANWFGGLPVLAPFHSLVAWTFATFIVGHVYMTTTGATPLEAMRAMVTGYEEVEVHEHVEEVSEKEGESK